jgi:undecaprenyl-diphosphatase
VLGAVQGPAELLPVSSSAHITLLPWFAGWGWDRLDPAARKDFEVALHAGTLAALVVGQRRVIAREVERLDTRTATAIVLAAAIPAAIGFAFERPIEERLSGPVSIAAGLVAGAAAMLLADRRPQDRDPDELGPWDGLALGAAQGAALYPGISRTGATVAAARWRRFSRREANLLSRTVALPIIVGAVALRGRRLRHDPPGPAERRGMAVGAVAAAASTLASHGLIAARDRKGSAWPYALYRVAVAGAVLIKLRRGA